MLIELEGYDWEQAFEYAHQAFVPGPKSIPFGGFTREQVKTIIGMYEGANESDPWLILGELESGDFFFLEAGCDYTGWDCQADGRAYRSTCLDDLVHWLTDEQKNKLHIMYAKCQNCGYLSTMVEHG